MSCGFCLCFKTKALGEDTIVEAVEHQVVVQKEGVETNGVVPQPLGGEPPPEQGGQGSRKGSKESRDSGDGSAPGLKARRRSNLTTSRKEALPEWAKSETSLSKFLESHGINVSAFGKGNAKTLATLLKEVEEGESSLQVENGKVVRSVQPIFIHLRHGSKLLVLKSQVFEDGRKRTSLQRVIAEKKGPGDGGTYDAAIRGMENALSIPADRLQEEGALQYREDLYGFELENFESPSFPGLQTQYETHYVQFNILEQGLSLFTNRGLPDGTDFETEEVTHLGTKVHSWTWMEVVKAKEQKVKKFPPMSLEVGPGEELDISKLKTDQDLKALLENDGVDTTKFGVGKAKAIGALLKEIQEGSSKLEINRSNGRLQRTVEPAFVQLRHAATNKVLVEQMQILEDGRERKRNMVLAEKFEPGDADVVSCCLRGIKEELSVELPNLPSLMTFREDKYCMMLETLDSASYPGVQCVYRTHYAQVDILEGGLHLFKTCGLPGGENFTTEETSSKGTKVMHWQWLDGETVIKDKVKGILQTAKGTAEDVAWQEIKDVTAANIRDVLASGGVPVMDWVNQGRRIQALLQEIKKGLCTLEKSPVTSKIRRVVCPAFITVKQQGGNLVLSGNQTTSKSTNDGTEPRVKSMESEEMKEQMKIRKQASVDGAFEASLHGQTEIIDAGEASKLDKMQQGINVAASEGCAVTYRTDLTCFESALNDELSFPGLLGVQRTKRLHLDTCVEQKGDDGTKGPAAQKTDSGGIPI